MKSFPKRDRHALGARIEDCALNMLDLILLSSKRSSPSKMDILEKLDATITREKILVRLAHKIKALSDNTYMSTEKQLIEMGREIGGWLKYERNKVENNNINEKKKEP